MSSLKQRIKKLASKAYRDAYVSSHLTQGIAYQIRALRECRSLTQAGLASKLGLKTQSAVARLEDPSYEGVSISTLKKLASAFDVALLVKFVSYSDFLDSVRDVSPRALAVPTFDEEHELLEQKSTTANKYVAETKPEDLVGYGYWASMRSRVHSNAAVDYFTVKGRPHKSVVINAGNYHEGV